MATATGAAAVAVEAEEAEVEAEEAGVEAGVAVAAAATDVSQAERGIQKSVLPNGIRVVTESMPGALSVSTGFWVGVGSRDEPIERAGASHFLEHLLFKGTPTRTARDISMAVDAVGGEINAFTTREHTAYYTRLPAAQMQFGLELLSDVITSPAFRPKEVEAERDVILEELFMNEDTPDDLVHSALYESLFPDHPLGRETLGSRETIAAMTCAQIAEFFEAWYRPANLVIAAAGDLEHDAVLDAVAGCFPGAEAGTKPVRTAPLDDITPLIVTTRATEQVHLALGWRGIHYDDPSRYALLIANHAIGGGLSSRLFHEVREERGLAYTIFTSPSSYADSGSIVLYGGTVPDRAGELLDVVDDVIEGAVTDGITEEEHRVALGYLEGSLVLGLEDSGSRMARLGTGEIVRGEVISIAEHLERLRAVTLEDTHQVLKRMFDAPRSLSVVGPFSEDDALFDRFR
ncbi:MAG: insulinase family protein [Actinobacteria bacterium]|nr:insulinase family protein [Actinomycetota bacterium]